MKKEKYMSWDAYFMSVALLSSFRSKDKLTQNGACIVDKNKKIIGMGYNGLPTGCSDEDFQFWTDNDDNPEFSRHSYVVHAEKNAIYNSIGSSLSGSAMYMTQFPCTICTQAIIQVGIKKIVYLNIKPHHEDQNRAVLKMLNSAGIEYIAFQDIEINDKEFIKELGKINKKLY